MRQGDKIFKNFGEKAKIACALFAKFGGDPSTHFVCSGPALGSTVLTTGRSGLRGFDELL